MNTILLINPPSKNKNINRDMAGGLGFSGGNGIVLPPLDLLNVAIRLEKLGNKILFIDAVAENKDNSSEIYKKIKKEKISLLIGLISLPTIDEDIDFYKKIKENFSNIKVVIKTGINYENILKKIFIESRCDLIVFSECDLDIEGYLNGEKVDGTLYKINDKLVFNNIRRIIKNLDLLPINSRKFLKNDLYKFSLLKGVCTTMQTTRGCPFPCSYYCPYPLVQGKQWRFMSAKRVFREINEIYKLNIRNILFRDATFTLDKKRTVEICRLIIESKLKINWWCETRINVLDEELLIIMKKSGCQGINVGVETLDKNLISNEGKPGVSLDNVIEIRKLAKKIGVKLHFLMIIGLPDDNVESLKNTFEYFVRLKPESAGFTLITPYPGTKMFEDSVKSKLVMNFDWNRFNGITANMKTKYLSLYELKFARFLLQVSSFASKRRNLLSNLLIIQIRLVFKLWEKIKRE